MSVDFLLFFSRPSFCLHGINYTSEAWTGYIYMSSASSSWWSDEWFCILALFARTKHAVIPPLEWFLSGQMWPCNRKTCPVNPCTHEAIFLLCGQSLISSYLPPIQHISSLSCLKERLLLYEWAIHSSKHQREGEKQNCDWPRQTSLQYMLPGAISEG